MNEFLYLPEERRRQFIKQVNSDTGMTEKAVEKDWWVTLVLKALFTLPMAEHFIFKGGTSLSKAWGLIERLSEDIDIALAPEAFGRVYKTAPSHSYVKQLKRDGTAYTSTVIANALLARLQEMGVPQELFSVSVDLIRLSLPDKDPQTLFIHYRSLYEANAYIPDVVKVEFGVRSLKEPFAKAQILSAIGSRIKVTSYTEISIAVPTVVPEKTFIEKLLLLHEKFSGKDNAEIIIAERQSRHLADIVQLKRKGIHKGLLEDPALFNTLVEHRRHYIRLKGVDYDQMVLNNLKIVPPPGTREQFKVDYKIMHAEMIYGDSPDFDTIIEELEQLAELLRAHPIKNLPKTKTIR